MMDHHASPLSVKPNDSKPKTNTKLNQAPKMGTLLPQIFRQKRVFGAARSTNIPTRPLTHKFMIEPKLVVPQKQPKSEPTEKEFHENANPRLNKKCEAFLKRQTEKTPKNSTKEERDSAEPRTPAASHFRTTKSKLSATPFYSALHCSKCRLDRLETSSYWIAQIKLAESVGKHFVAVDFFRLAIESQAEPMRNLRIELKRYLKRHAYLSEQKEWRETVIKYGVLKVEDNNCEVDSSTENNQKSSMSRENDSNLG